MDLREKFARDLMDVMHENDKSFPEYDDIEKENIHHVHGMAEGMLKKGWFFDIEKGKI